MRWESHRRLLIDANDFLPGSLARGPHGQALLGLDLGLCHHESFVSGQLSDFIQIIQESSSAW